MLLISFSFVWIVVVLIPLWRRKVKETGLSYKICFIRYLLGPMTLVILWVALWYASDVITRGFTIYNKFVKENVGHWLLENIL